MWISHTSCANTLSDTPQDRSKEDTMYEHQNQTIVQKTVKTGLSFGSALAMVISYVNWHSVGWAIFHGLLSWAYVIYYIIRY